MTTPEPPSPAAQPQSKDRVYRSPAGIAGGVMLLALGAWLGIDALVNGEARVRWLAIAGLLLAVPLVVAFTVRPAVYANEDRLRIRNPFRTVTLPWAAVSGLRSGYSNEVFDQSGAKYQLWAIPVSLRARKKAARRQTRAAADDPRGHTSPVPAGSVRASGDQAMDELRELAEARASAEGAQGGPEVRWAYEVAGPAVVGLVLLVVLLAL
ncbi:PH domain-containing protein [Streptomyces sp. NPDC002896]|uniref:PH domain-containing protein n=1 Tax=Streptomyces sp. NPDC002896 TaxID=3154438 RepID=UPI00331ADD01